VRALPPPFPAGLRRPRPRRARLWVRWLPLALPAVLPLALLWRVGTVQIQGCPGLPASACRSLHDLVGTPVVLLHLDRIRDDVQAWPGVALVEVRFEAPGTLSVTAHPAEAAGSVRVGRGWRAVCADGQVGAALTAPQPPVLAGFGADRGKLASALVVGRRLARQTGLVVRRLRRILPDDLEVVLADSGGESYTIHVVPGGSRAERAWCELLRTGGAGAWADLRGDFRMVVGGAR